MPSATQAKEKTSGGELEVLFCSCVISAARQWSLRMPLIKSGRRVVNTLEKVPPTILAEKLPIINSCLLFSLAGTFWTIRISGEQLRQVLGPNPAKALAPYIKSGTLRLVDAGPHMKLCELGNRPSRLTWRLIGRLDEMGVERFLEIGGGVQ
ncbi:MAG: hypothetical protein ACKVP3_23090 [Hyphomicrobiaceae bacterium]